MKEIEQLIYGRMTADTAATVGLVALLGAATQIAHAFQLTIPPVPYLTFQVFSGGKGMATGDFARSLDYFIAFNAFASNYADILARVRHLFDGYRFDVPGSYTEIGSLRSVFDFEGPDGFDEVLETQTKQVRYRFFMTPKAWNPIAA